MVEIIVCPKETLPKDIGYKRKLSNDNSTIKPSNSFKVNSRLDRKNQKALTQKEIRLLHDEIKEFSGSALQGSAKNRFKEDILTKLGAPPPKQMKVPLPLKLKLLKSRKEKLLKETKAKVESGVVSNKTSNKQLSKTSKPVKNKNNIKSKQTNSGILRVDPTKFLKKK